MTPQEMRAVLEKTLADRRLSGSEKQALAAVIAEAALDDRQRAVFRHEAFDLARRAAADPAAREALDWLEEVNKLLLPPTGDGEESATEVFFSPGEACTQQIIRLFGSARRSADVCVFTITDDRITRAVLGAHRRGVAVRVLTDDDKAADLGSDIAELRTAGVPTRQDNSPYHMHHKFALFDRALVLNGSFNWTRSAASNNEENLVFSNDRRLVTAFQKEFDRLWANFA